MKHFSAIKILKSHAEKLKAELRVEQANLKTSNSKEESLFATSSLENIQTEINKITESIQVLIKSE